MTMDSLRALAKLTLLRYQLDPSEPHPEEDNIEVEGAVALEERIRKYITGQGFAIDWMAKSRDEVMVEVYEFKKQLEMARDENETLMGEEGRDNGDLRVDTQNEILRKEVAALKEDLLNRDDEIEQIHAESMQLNERLRKAVEEVKEAKALKKVNEKLRMENDAFRKDLDVLENEARVLREGMERRTLELESWVRVWDARVARM